MKSGSGTAGDRSSSGRMRRDTLLSPGGLALSIASLSASPPPFTVSPGAGPEWRYGGGPRHGVGRCGLPFTTRGRGGPGWLAHSKAVHLAVPHVRRYSATPDCMRTSEKAGALCPTGRELAAPLTAFFNSRAPTHYKLHTRPCFIVNSAPRALSHLPSTARSCVLPLCHAFCAHSECAHCTLHIARLYVSMTARLRDASRATLHFSRSGGFAGIAGAGAELCPPPALAAPAFRQDSFE
eukprot:scaffold10462_cov119-Isochrysis_galbana.AAC.4